LSQVMASGGSPRLTPHTVRVRMPSESPSWKEKGSIIGGTGRIRRRIKTWEQKKENRLKKGHRHRVLFTIDHELLCARYLSCQIARHTWIVAIVIWRQTFNQENAIELIHLCDWDPLGGVQGSPILQPRDRQRQVTLGHRARQTGTFSHMLYYVWSKWAKFGRNWN